MSNYRTVFSQLLDLVPRYRFQTYVDKYEGDKRSRKLDCWSQFCALFYSQVRQRDSLRGIAEGLETQSTQLYHIGMNPIKRSTFSDANNKRSYQIYEDTFNFLLKKCQKLSRGVFKFTNPIRSMDATVIDLCYSIYPWAKYRTRKGGIKIHVEMSHQPYLPEAVVVTDGKTHEINIAKATKIKPDSIYVFDRAYIDFDWLNSINTQGAKFVVRAKKDMRYLVTGQHDIKADSNVISDEDISVPWRRSQYPSKSPKYRHPLRLVTYVDPSTEKVYRFLTNIEDFKPDTIALIYKQRWQIELFFKWIKQNLKLKSFIGASKNAVLTQIFVAMITYLIIWYMKHQTQYEKSLLSLSRIINETFFQKISLIDLLGTIIPKATTYDDAEQLSLGFT